MTLVVRDFISPGLRRLARRAEDPKPVLEAVGLQLASIAARSFNNPSLRVVPWPSLKPGTVKARLAAGKSTSYSNLWQGLVALQACL